MFMLFKRQPPNDIVETLPPEDFRENLKTSIRAHDVQRVTELVAEAKEKGFNLNFNDPKTKYTPLHFAIVQTRLSHELDMLEILELLQKAGCDLNRAANDSLHNTPIHTACRRGLTSTVGWLIDNGANPNAKDTRGNSPLHYIEKQAVTDADHMTEHAKERLEDIKILLTSNRFVGFLKRF